MRQSAGSKGQTIADDFSFSGDIEIPAFSYVPVFGCFQFSSFRALKAGMQRPLLVCPPHKDYKNSSLVAALGALQALYMVKKKPPLKLFICLENFFFIWITR